MILCWLHHIRLLLSTGQLNVQRFRIRVHQEFIWPLAYVYIIYISYGNTAYSKQYDPMPKEGMALPLHVLHARDTLHALLYICCT